MAVIDLDLFKKHVRSDEFSDDDAYMQHLLDAAEELVTSYTNRTEDELIAIGDGIFPVSLQQAILMLAAHWYNQRESDSTTQMHEVPDSMSAIVKRFCKLT